MKFLLLSLLLISGCTTAPITYKFPAAPSLEQCTPLKQHEVSKRKPSEVAATIAENYSESNKCAAKVDLWINWYIQQKELFDNL